MTIWIVLSDFSTLKGCPSLKVKSWSRIAAVLSWSVSGTASTLTEYTMDNWTRRASTTTSNIFWREEDGSNIRISLALLSSLLQVIYETCELLISLQVKYLTDFTPNLVTFDFDLMAGLRVDLHNFLDALPYLKYFLCHHVHLSIQFLISKFFLSQIATLSYILVC